jgi:hypothetical protein
MMQQYIHSPGNNISTALATKYRHSNEQQYIHSPGNKMTQLTAILLLISQQQYIHSPSNNIAQLCNKMSCLTKNLVNQKISHIELKCEKK